MLLLLFVLVLPNASLGSSIAGYIVGGTDVNIADFPWQGSFRRPNDQHNCGCAFVGHNIVISASHCGGDTSFTIEFGASTNGQGTVYDIERVTLHPAYMQGPGHAPNDISIVLTTKPIVTTSVIRAASIPQNALTPTGTAMITGWGKLCGSCGPSLDLQGTPISMITDDECKDIWKDNYHSDIMMCVWDGEEATVGSCQGDSGGPLSIGSTVYGIASWGSGACSPSKPAVYAKVGAYRDWICGETNGKTQGC